MGERLEFSALKHAQEGPVITISRECGCPGNEIAEMLSKKLNLRIGKERTHSDWKWVSKEILLKASHELKINPKDVESFIKSNEKGMLHDLVASFTETNFVRNAKIKKTIYDVIRNLACEGHVVIVGRGGGAIVWDIPKSLHIYLEAPLSWKTNVISNQKGISIAEARKFVIESDMQRKRFRDSFRSEFSDEIYYEERFNCKVLSNDRICDLVIQAAELKKLI